MVLLFIFISIAWPIILSSDCKSFTNNTQLIKKQTDKNSCLSCSLLKGELQCIGGIISATEHFVAQQDYAVPIPGFIIISSKRHIQSIDEFNSQERNDFIEFLCKIRKGMRECLKIKTVYLIQEEDASHFHLWLFPRYDWMKQFGKKIKSVKPIMKWAQEKSKN